MERKKIKSNLKDRKDEFIWSYLVYFNLCIHKSFIFIVTGYKIFNQIQNFCFFWINLFWLHKEVKVQTTVILH